VTDLGQVHLPTVHPLSSLVSNRHDTCPESRRRVQSTVTYHDEIIVTFWSLCAVARNFRYHYFGFSETNWLFFSYAVYNTRPNLC